MGSNANQMSRGPSSAILKAGKAMEKTLCPRLKRGGWKGREWAGPFFYSFLDICLSRFTVY